MNKHIVPLGNVMLLQLILENGGTAKCQVRRPESTLDATIHAHLESEAVQVDVTVDGTTGTLKLQRGDTAKYQHLRDFIQELANNRTEHAVKALALLEAQQHVNATLPDGHVAYISPTPWQSTPFAVVVTDNTGQLCAVACGANKEHLVELVLTKLRPTAEGHGECA